MISIQRVYKRFGSFVAVDGVSLEIPPAHIFGIIGPNGAGKSTLFRMICQLYFPDEGVIEVCGHRDVMAIKRCIGYMPEEHHLYESLTTFSYLRYFGDLLGLPAARADEVLRYVGLSHKRDEKISRLSKGMRQKVVFARTLLANPPVLILDEPTYGLDPHTSREMRDWVQEAAKTRTVVMSSHNMYESERLCDAVAIVHRGKVVAQGRPRDLVLTLKTQHILDVRYRGQEEILIKATQTLPLSRPPVPGEGSVRLYFPMNQDPYGLIRSLLDGVRGASDTFGIEALIPREPTLEDVFIQVTGEVWSPGVAPTEVA